MLLVRRVAQTVKEEGPSRGKADGRGQGRDTQERKTGRYCGDHSSIYIGRTLGRTSRRNDDKLNRREGEKMARSSKTTPYSSAKHLLSYLFTHRAFMGEGNLQEGGRKRNSVGRGGEAGVNSVRKRAC